MLAGVARLDGSYFSGRMGVGRTTVAPTELETVFAITLYHDGIWSGIANFHGRPSVFHLADENRNGALAIYALTALPPGVDLTLLERAASDIWHPPSEIEDLVDRQASQVASELLALGEFVPEDGPPNAPVVRVRWTPL
jgi:hypothetical protein